MVEIKRYKRILTFISLLFILILGYMTYFQVVKADKLKNSEDNKRNWVDDNKLKRGNILDSNGNILAETKTDEKGDKFRYFPYGEAYAHIVGYNSKKYGKTGIEKKFNTTLLNKQDKTPIGELKKILIDQKEGNSVKLTTNTELQKYALSLLEGHKGSMILMNPQTGSIIAMADRPTFDPNKIESNWANIISDEENAPLLARSTSGLFTPGSVYKLITGTALLEKLSGSDLNYNDKGSTTIDHYKINNYAKEVNGNIDLRKALVKSSNTYFADQVQKIGVDSMIDVSKRFMFGQEIPFELKTAISPIPYNDKTTALELGTAAFGQGKDLVTPLQVALYTSAIANGGNMMKPHIVSEILDPSGKIIEKVTPEVLSKVADKKIMDTMKDYLKSSGDRNFAGFVKGKKVAGKTGTAEKTKDKIHSWVTVFYPVDNPTIVCTAFFEEENKIAAEMIPLVKKLVNKAIELGY